LGFVSFFGGAEWKSPQGIWRWSRNATIYHENDIYWLESFSHVFILSNIQYFRKSL